MATKKRVCDICGREIPEPDNFFRFKVKSSSFVTYVNYDNWNPDVRHFDICQDCLNEIANRVNKKEEMKND